MKLFVLAAGKGTRLWPLTKNTPKSIIELGDGTTLLERQIHTSIKSKIIDEVVLITGYRAEQIDAKILEYQKDIKISVIYNPVYDITNNLVSLWTAHYKMLEDDFIITNGDNIYKDNVFNKIQPQLKEIIQVTIDYKEHYDDDDMKVAFDEEGNIKFINKAISLNETSAESVGLVLVKGERSRTIFVNKILNLVRDKEYLNKFWLEIFNALVNDGVGLKKVEIHAQEWREVDFHPDVEILKKLILKGF